MSRTAENTTTRRGDRMNYIELDPNARCAIAGCSEPPTRVYHFIAGNYQPDRDPHVCDEHHDAITEADVRTWSRGWQAGYRAGQRRAELDRNKTAKKDAWREGIDTACDRLPCWKLRGHEGPCEPGRSDDPRRVTAAEES